MGRSKPRVVVVSNRGPYRSEESGGKRRWIRSAGGLVTALDPVLRQRGGVWVSAEEADEDHHTVVDAPDSGYRLATVKISRADREGFYQGMSNALLWPLLHSFPPTIRVGEAPWGSYVKANRAFTHVTLDTSEPDDVVWVQDYHLMLAPEMIRAARPRGRIGWFCHVPWPPPELFSILPWRRQMLAGLLGADLLGFHTEEYVQNFLECVQRLTSFEVDAARRTVRVDRRSVRVVPAPIGVAVDEISRLVDDPELVAEAARIRESVNGRRIVIGVDRLDYTKGIPERMIAYARYLERDRSARDRYAFVQVMVPSRTDVLAYAQLKAEIDRLVGSINGRYAATGQVAIHYLYRNLDSRSLYAHYMAADVALVTPLRDGMNLVAHEYAMSRRHNDGVLILSEFAGAARYLPDALLVNPYDIDAVSEAIERAFSMPEAEMRARMEHIRREVKKLDVHRWADRTLSALESTDLTLAELESV